MKIEVSLAKTIRVAMTMIILHTTASAADSTTHADPINSDYKTWYVELSRESLDWILERTPDRELQSTITNIKNDFEKYQAEVGNVTKAGFYWSAPLEGPDCHLFRVKDIQKIDKNDIIAKLPYDDATSCFRNATMLRNAIALYRMALHIQEVNSSGTTKLALGPQIFLLNYVLNSHGAQELQIESFSAANVLTSGYSVMEGDSLKSIAKALTGSENNWVALDVESLDIQEEQIDPNATFPGYGERVYLSEPAAKALLLSSTPGKVYSKQEIGKNWDEFRIQVSSDELSFLDGMNFHIANDWRSSESDMEFLFWAPHDVSDWRKFTVDSRDPVSIAESVYGTSAYEAIAAALCVPATLGIKETCTLPIFELPADATAWNWLKDRFDEASD